MVQQSFKALAEMGSTEQAPGKGWPLRKTAKMDQERVYIREREIVLLAENLFPGLFFRRISVLQVLHYQHIWCMVSETGARSYVVC